MLESARPVSSLKPVSPADIETTIEMVKKYSQPYRDMLRRREQEIHLEQMLTGLTSNLERKSVEPIAVMHGVPRKVLQRFVGENGWQTGPLVDQLCQEVSQEIGIANGTVIVDGSATPKKGEETVGVARQWCGRLGKVDSCVIGVHAAYVGADESAALVASELFLPKAWCSDRERREKTHIPKDRRFLSQAEMATSIVAALAERIPFEWVLGDDEFGRARHFRDGIADLGKSYALDVPSNTSVRKLTKYGWVKERNWAVETIAKRLRPEDWSCFRTRDGEKQPIEIKAFSMDVATRRASGKWVRETLLIIETLDGTQRWYLLVRARVEVPLQELVRQAGFRHRIEEVFEECKGEVGLDHFEVRAWHGWYHHMTLVQIAHWFLVREQRRLGKKRTRGHDQPDSNGHRATSVSGTHGGTSSGADQLPSDPKPSEPDRSLPGTWAAASYYTPSYVA